MVEGGTKLGEGENKRVVESQEKDMSKRKIQVKRQDTSARNRHESEETCRKGKSQVLEPEPEAGTSQQ